MSHHSDDPVRTPSSSSPKTSGFLRLDELIQDQGEVALIISTDHDTPHFPLIEASSDFHSPSPSRRDLCLKYIMASDLGPENHLKNNLDSDMLSLFSSVVPGSLHSTDIADPVAIFAAKRKYKPVAQKTRPVLADLPEKFRIVRNILGDPLAALPTLTPNPPPFTPTGRYTAERRDLIDKVHSDDFLWPAEQQLMHHFMCLQEMGFAWDDSERGRFREDFFPPVNMPVVKHKPWVQRNIPIPPGDEHAPALGSEGGRREALGRYRTALDKYRRCRLLPNTIGPYPTDDKPPKDVRQHLGQFAHTSRTYHDRIGVLR
ncbi:hypothetical protein HETIRDRAFT_165449 [Heterobasidion irregulare TC 32-1]|uniref:Uncharacterized protein n=3 Tax=Heterobasidion irregulare (strain TC 32-1) TaxID=747525 RepID=W4KC75_HETIT|nr:uncharacterized protein HETIRDRAFT_165449 [Heterobasidion irregulare TC 32-1]ETW82681.1 hypothetical protein HETIRDRAFT_165449 [Heterobasidion irregulare TC 32-1]